MITENMLIPFEIKYPNHKIATAVNIVQTRDIAPALQLLGLQGRAVISIIGGAGGMSNGDLEKVRPVFQTIAKFAHQNNAVIVDGGTDSGVMRLLGQTKNQFGLEVLLAGIAASGTVTYPGKEAEIEDAAELESNHDYFILVPGNKWGDESSWINDIVNSFSGKKISILINGGPITKIDYALALSSKRQILVLAGTGRFADYIATEENLLKFIKVINYNDEIALKQNLIEGLKV